MPRSHLSLRLLILLAVAVSPAAAKAEESKPPNFVLVISDDQAATDFGFMGHPYIQTPHLDRLASESARYDHGYVPSSVCRPSLVTLLTGLYPHQHGVHFNHPPPGFSAMRRLSEEDYYAARGQADILIETLPTLPRTLSENGYRSFQSGKHWEGDYQLAGFTEGMTRNRPSAGPGYGNLTLASGEVVAHGNGDAGLDIGRHGMQPIDDFLDDHQRNHAEDPFLVWYAPFLPHLPHDAPQRFRQPYLADAQVPRHMVDYAAACTWFDETVGQLMTSLEDRGLAEETLILFVIDNGYGPDPRTQPGEEGLVDNRTKRAPFEAGLQTPILIRWPGQIERATHQGLVHSIDIVPTLLAAAGQTGEMGDLPGINLLPSATGQEDLKDRVVFGEIYPGDATDIGRPGRDVAYRWVRRGDLKLIVPHVRGKTAWRNYLSQPGLYDVVRDPEERENLSENPRYTHQLGELNALLDGWWTPDDEAVLPRLNRANSGP
ncbi:MAG: sulfatase-like hydrolase/transferase [Pirellulaceae bacterium]